VAKYEDLPKYKAAFDLVLYFEKIVKNFSRYNKYTHGADLRNLSRQVVMLVNPDCPPHAFLFRLQS